LRNITGGIDCPDHRDQTSFKGVASVPIYGPGIQHVATNPEAIKFLMAPQPNEREAYVEHLTNTYKMIRIKSFLDEEWHRIKFAQSYDRSFNPNGSSAAAAIARK
jgi:hypothetical protein